MLRIPCPWCGTRDHSEFDYHAPADVTYPDLDNENIDDWHQAVYLRDNPRGGQKELWQHSRGCRLWLIVERDTLTHEIRSVEIAHDRLRASMGEVK